MGSERGSERNEVGENGSYRYARCGLVGVEDSEGEEWDQYKIDMVKKMGFDFYSLN